MTGLTDVDARARELFGKDFVDCGAKSQVEILQALDDEVAATRAEPEPRSRRRRPPERNFFFMMKQLTLIGYYTSQIGFEQELHGEIIPARHAALRPSGRGGGEIIMAAKTYDAIVVGSGITGGWAAKELGEKGLETLVLEAGRPIDPDKDYVEHVPEWEVRYRGMSDRKRVQENQSVQETCGGMDEWNSKFFVNDKQNPYTTDRASPSCGFADVRWVAVRSSGDGSPIVGAILILKPTNAKASAWIGRSAIKDIAPWYDYVEDFIGVSGQSEGLPQLARRTFSAADGIELRGSGGQGRYRQIFSRRASHDHWAHRDPDPPHNGRAACHYCGPCDRGCITRSYFSSLNSTLPAALNTGKLTVRPHSVVHSLIFDSKKRKITGVRVIDGKTRDSHRVSRTHCFPVCLGAGVRPHPAEFFHAGIPQRPGQFQRRTRTQCDGPLYGRRRHRPHSGKRRSHLIGKPPEWNLRSPLPQRETETSAVSCVDTAFKAEQAGRSGSGARI